MHLGRARRERESNPDFGVHCGVHHQRSFDRDQIHRQLSLPGCGRGLRASPNKTRASNQRSAIWSSSLKFSHRVASPTTTKRSSNTTANSRVFGSTYSSRRIDLTCRYSHVKEARGPWFFTFVKTLDAVVRLSALGLLLADVGHLSRDLVWERGRKHCKGRDLLASFTSPPNKNSSVLYVSTSGYPCTGRRHAREVVVRMEALAAEGYPRAACRRRALARGAASAASCRHPRGGGTS